MSAVCRRHVAAPKPPERLYSRYPARSITDGPFAETREQLGGYFLIEAQDLDEAIAIAIQASMASRGTVEIRGYLPRGARVSSVPAHYLLPRV